MPPIEVHIFNIFLPLSRNGCVSSLCSHGFLVGNICVLIDEVEFELVSSFDAPERLVLNIRGWTPSCSSLPSPTTSTLQKEEEQTNTRVILCR